MLALLRFRLRVFKIEFIVKTSASISDLQFKQKIGQTMSCKIMYQ
ncbi:hypothetical protein SPWS13_1010 [Shewanella putrefaciens]|nr:hypothetical protein SPWS13_1010 [Shewanella putrefaciens]